MTFQPASVHTPPVSQTPSSAAGSENSALPPPLEPNPQPTPVAYNGRVITTQGPYRTHTVITTVCFVVSSLGLGLASYGFRINNLTYFLAGQILVGAAGLTFTIYNTAVSKYFKQTDAPAPV